MWELGSQGSGYLDLAVGLHVKRKTERAEVDLGFSREST